VPQPLHVSVLCILYLTLTLKGIILGTHHEKGAFTFWSYAIGLPLPSSSILSWKFCHVLHKVLRDGHPNVNSFQYLWSREERKPGPPIPLVLSSGSRAVTLKVCSSGPVSPNACCPLLSLLLWSKEQMPQDLLGDSGSSLPSHHRCYMTASATGATSGRSVTCG
jgi:hypothetical protein